MLETSEGDASQDQNTYTSLPSKLLFPYILLIIFECSKKKLHIALLIRTAVMY